MKQSRRLAFVDQKFETVQSKNIAEHQDLELLQWLDETGMYMPLYDDDDDDDDDRANKLS